MTRAVELLVLVQRLRPEAARRGDSELAIDLRLACRHLRQYAAQWIAVEADRTRDLGAQRRLLIAEAAELLRKRASIRPLMTADSVHGLLTSVSQAV
jgi:hypothetical protein